VSPKSIIVRQTHPVFFDDTFRPPACFMKNPKLLESSYIQGRCPWIFSGYSYRAGPINSERHGPTCWTGEAIRPIELGPLIPNAMVQPVGLAKQWALVDAPRFGARSFDATPTSSMFIYLASMLPYLASIVLASTVLASTVRASTLASMLALILLASLILRCSLLRCFHTSLRCFEASVRYLLRSWLRCSLR
jgi:hypothetical protein